MENRLKTPYYPTIKRNAILLNAAQEIFKILNESGVDFIPLRGIDYIHRFYHDDISARWMEDIDILIQRKDLAALKDIMLKEGYESVLRLQDDYFFDKPSGNITVRFDVRDNIPYIDTDEFWKNSEVYKTPDYEYRIFKPEYDMLYQVMHAYYQHYDNFPHPIWLADIDKLIDYYKSRLDWKRLAHLAKRFKAEYGLYSVLNYLKGNFGAFVPDEILSGILRLRLRDRLILTYRKHKRNDLQSALLILNRHGLRNKARFFLDNFFPSKKWMKMRYGQGKNVYKFYFMRAFQGIKKFWTY